MKNSRKRPNYSVEEIEALIENYTDLSFYYRHKQYIQVRLMDIERVLPRVHEAERTAVFLCGVMRFTTRAAGKIAGASKDTMHRRYTKGLELIFEQLNDIK